MTTRRTFLKAAGTTLGGLLAGLPSRWVDFLQFHAHQSRSFPIDALLKKAVSAARSANAF